MEAAILAALIRYGVPLLIELLKKWGFFDAAEALAAKTAVEIVVDIKNTKTYQEYPLGKNGLTQTGTPVPCAETNINKT